MLRSPTDPGDSTHPKDAKDRIQINKRPKLEARTCWHFYSVEYITFGGPGISNAAFAIQSIAMHTEANTWHNQTDPKLEAPTYCPT